MDYVEIDKACLKRWEEEERSGKWKYRKTKLEKGPDREYAEKKGGGIKKQLGVDDGELLL